MRRRSDRRRPRRALIVYVVFEEFGVAGHRLEVVSNAVSEHPVERPEVLTLSLQRQLVRFPIGYLLVHRDELFGLAVADEYRGDRLVGDV